MKTYSIVTMGCQMNERDSETIAGLLEQMGYTAAEKYEDADVVVVNTCSVRENADNRFFGMLGHIKHVKLARPDVIVCVCGCMMQQEHITEQIKDKHSWVDLIFGTHNIDALPDMIGEVLRTRKPAEYILQERESLVEGLPARRQFPFKASVNIMYGCNNFCTYCVVPYTRGREVSRSPGNILSEVRELASSGTKEIMLLGQNVNSYAGEGTDFAGLIGMVNEVPGIERIRFMTSHPKDLSSKLVDKFRTAEHLCPSIHLPVQSGSTRVLERMNRKYTKEGYIALIEELRKARPDIVISTDFIVGFPGENEEDFEDTMDVIERVRFDAAFTFLFSPRRGTPAADYEDTEPEEKKMERFNRMVQRLNAITLEKNKAYVGGVYDVLVEGASKTGESMIMGRTFGNKLVNFPAPEGAELTGTIVPVRITAVKTFSFTGELI